MSGTTPASLSGSSDICKYGLGLSEAFNIFLTQSVLQRGIPFEIKIPNDETLEAIKDARAKKNMSKVNLEDLKEDIKCLN